MIDQPKASKLAREAFDEWQSGRREQSRLLYEEAICLADPGHYRLSDYYCEYACVLNELGRHEQATTQLEKSLATEIAQGEVEGTPAILVARYFLADQLLRHGDFELALETLSPSLIHAPDHWLTRLEEAQTLYALGRKIEAKAAAALAITYAPNPKKAEQLKQNLKNVFDDLEP